MFKYICKRIGISILILIGVSMIIYFLIRLMPVDPQDLPSEDKPNAEIPAEASVTNEPIRIVPKAIPSTPSIQKDSDAIVIRPPEYRTKDTARVTVIRPKEPQAAPPRRVPSTPMPSNEPIRIGKEVKSDREDSRRKNQNR